MKRRTNITINESIYAKAQELMELDGFSDFSGYVEQLIRDEWNRKHPNRGSRPIGDEFPRLQADIAATQAGKPPIEGQCLTAEPAPAYRVNSDADPAARRRAEVESLEHDMVENNLRKLGPPAKRQPRKPKGAK